MEFVKSFNRVWLVVVEHSSSVDFYDLLNLKNLAPYLFRISDVRVIGLIFRSRNHLELNVSKFETDKFLSPMGRLCRYFLSLLLL